MTQGRTDFAADHPDVIARLARMVVMVLSGFRSNDDDSLAALGAIELGEEQARERGDARSGSSSPACSWRARIGRTSSSIALRLRGQPPDRDPLFSVLTPLPGTQLYKAYEHQLLTTDHRLFDLFSSSRRDSRATSSTKLARGPGRRSRRPQSVSHHLKKRGTFRGACSSGWSGSTRAPGATSAPLLTIARSFATKGLLDGPGRINGVTWRDVRYPSGEDQKIVRLRLTKGCVMTFSDLRKKSKRIRPSITSFSTALHEPVREAGLSRVRREPLSKLTVFTSYLGAIAPSRVKDMAGEGARRQEYGEGSEGMDHATLYAKFLSAAGATSPSFHCARSPTRRSRSSKHRRIVIEPFLVGLGAVGPGHEWAIPKMFEHVIGTPACGLRRRCSTSRSTSRDEDHGRWLEEALALHVSGGNGAPRFAAAPC
jgi:hypothetical protein